VRAIGWRRARQWRAGRLIAAIIDEVHRLLTPEHIGQTVPITIIRPSLILP
jgi:hypothetical protein